MTFDEWWTKQPAKAYIEAEEEFAWWVWEAALAAERDRCAKIIWEYRGCCVTDTSARALMVEVRRER